MSSKNESRRIGNANQRTSQNGKNGKIATHASRGRGIPFFKLFCDRIVIYQPTEFGIEKGGDTMSPAQTDQGGRIMWK